ncbi:hypothetical protein cgR_1890 [Corynebacterium glutamicum R]|uniref:Uncharacterized protein n=2 Tax=Corynebacterium glutamicum TaxID=1718 RepID=Q5KRI8_CORGT|nr:hypothetical protein [Corynebacterium glutamicum]BAF54885.1 hypothetical protein cgR_1890 [Corynebacterium glutamicum R]
MLEVSEDDARKLAEMGALRDQTAEVESVDAAGDEDDTQVAPTPVEEVAVGKKFPELPKKTQGVNAWKEYARLNEIDIRGLSEKSEIMGQVMKVVNA